MSSAECLSWELETHFPSPATLDESLLFPVPHLIQGNGNCTPAVGLLNGFHRHICTLIHTMPRALCNKCKVIKLRKTGYVLTSPRAMQVEALREGVRGGSKEHVQRTCPGSGKVLRLPLHWVVLTSWALRRGKVGGHFLQDRENRDALGGPVMGSSTARRAGACS